MSAAPRTDGGGSCRSVSYGSCSLCWRSRSVLHRTFEQQYLDLQTNRTYDVAPDGRFLMIKAPTDDGSAPAEQIILVENWFEELKRLVPVD